MNIPFSINEFLQVFERYNTTLWPFQLLLLLLAVFTFILIIRSGKAAGRIIFATLTVFWLWMGIVYHILYFSSINKAAYLFGSLFIVQGLIFLYVGVYKQKIHLKFRIDLPGVVGLILILYALIIYPILGHTFGHVFPRTPTFGVPCPTTIFTFGVLLFSVHRVPWYMIIIPFLWSLVGFSAAINLQVKEDFGLVVAGVAATIILLFFKPKLQGKSPD